MIGDLSAATACGVGLGVSLTETLSTFGLHSREEIISNETQNGKERIFHYTNSTTKAPNKFQKHIAIQGIIED